MTATRISGGAIAPSSRRISAAGVSKCSAADLLAIAQRPRPAPSRRRSSDKAACERTNWLRGGRGVEHIAHVAGMVYRSDVQITVPKRRVFWNWGVSAWVVVGTMRSNVILRYSEGSPVIYEGSFGVPQSL